MAGIVAAAIVGSAVVGGYAASKAAKSQAQATQSAAATSAGSARTATELQQRMYEEEVKRQEPWLKAGVNALGQLTAGTAEGGAYLRPFSMADYEADPGYAFRLKEGMRGLEQSAAARGGLLSGQTLKGVTGYGQEMASQEYQNAYNRYQTTQGTQFNRLASMAGLGQTANVAIGQAGSAYGTNVGNIGMQSAANIGNAQLAAGQAKASMYQGWGNALTSAGSNLGNLWTTSRTPTNYNVDYSQGTWV